MLPSVRNPYCLCKTFLKPKILISKFYIKEVELTPIFKREIVILRYFRGCIATTNQSTEDPKDLVKTYAHMRKFELRDVMRFWRLSLFEAEELNEKE